MLRADGSAVLSGTQHVSARGLPWRRSVAGGLSAVSRYVCYGGAFIAGALPLPIVYEAIVDHLNHPTDWVFEISGYAMIALALLASGYALQTGHHFRVTLLLTTYPRLAPYLEMFSGALVFLFGGFLLVAGWDQAHMSLLQNLRSDTLLAVPQFWPQLALPIGGAVIALQGLSFLIYPEGIPKEKQL